METRGRSTVVGLFHEDSRARDAVEALKDAGFRPDDIGFLARDRDRAENLARETGTEAGSGAATGAVGGGILGGLAGWLVGIGAIAIPGVGPFIAAGALGTALAGAAIGAGVGAVAGALVGMGIPKEEADWYEGEVRGGRTLVTVRANGRYSEARSILRRHGAYDIENREPDYSETTRRTTTGTTMSGSYATDPDWPTALPRYRSRWQSRYGNTGTGRWEDYEPSYRYGWEMSRRPEYRGRSWNEVEPEFRRDWGTRHHDMPWDRAAEWVRDAWENVSGEDRGTRTSTGFDERGFRGGSTTMDRDRTMPLREEELDVSRRRDKAGEVIVHKDVEEERRSMDVPYSKEEVHIERRPASGETTGGRIGEGDTIRVPVHEEDVDVEKRTVTREELVIGKERKEGTKRVEDTVRREVPRVETEGDVENLENLTEEERRLRRERKERF